MLHDNRLIIRVERRDSADFQACAGHSRKRCRTGLANLAHPVNLLSQGNRRRRQHFKQRRMSITTQERASRLAGKVSEGGAIALSKRGDGDHAGASRVARKTFA